MNILTPSTTTISSTSSLSNTNLVNSYSYYNAATTYAASTQSSPVIVTWNDGWYESIAANNLNFLPSNTAKWKYIGPSLLPVATLAQNNLNYPINTIVYDSNSYYKCLENNITFNNNYTNPLKWQNLGVVNILRQFDQYNYTNTVGQYGIKYTVQVPNVKDSTMKALSLTGLKNADTITLEVTPSQTSTRLNTNIIKLDNAIYIDTIWPGVDYNTTTNTGINYISNGNSEVESVLKIIDENLNTFWNQTYTSNSSGYPAVFTIKLNFPMSIKSVQFVTANNTNYDPTTIGVRAGNSQYVYDRDILISSSTSIAFPQQRSTETNIYSLNNTKAYLYYTFYFTNAAKNVEITDIILYYDSNDPKADKLSTQWKYIDLGVAKPTEIQYLPTANYIPISWNYPNQINSVTTTGETAVGDFEGANKLFDDDNAKWFEEQNIEFQNRTKWVSVTVKLNWQWCVQKVQFVTANDYEDRDPTVYAIFGSKDGIQWDLLKYDQNLQLPSARETASSIYNLNNMDSYLYYKVTFARTKTWFANQFGNSRPQYQLAELRLLYDSNDTEGYNIRAYNQFSNSNALGALAYTNTKRVIVAENQAPSKIYYNDSTLENITNFKTASITGLPQNYQLLINSVYHNPANNLLIAVGGDLALYSPALLVSQDNGTTWTYIDLSAIIVPVNASAQVGPFPLSPIWDVIYCAGSINKYVTIGYNNEILTSTDGLTWTYNSSISSGIYGAYFVKMNWTNNHGGVLMLPGTVQVNNQSKPGVAWTQNLTTWLSAGDASNYWYNNMNCVSYIYDQETSQGLWLAAGINVAMLGLWLDYTAPPGPYFISWTHVLFTPELQMQSSGTYNDIIPSTKDVGWILCGGGRLSSETARSGKIVSVTWPLGQFYTPWNIQLLHKDTANSPYSFNTIIPVDNIYLASIRTSLANNKPIYYNKETLTSASGTAKNFALFTTGLTDQPAEYDKLDYKIEITGGTNLQIANAMLHDTSLLLGTVQRGAGLSIVDYSTKNVDEFGNITIVERLTSNRVSVTVLISVSDINRIQTILNSVRAKPCVWSGSNLAKYQSLTLYGFYRNYEISLDNPELATLTLELESLV